MGKKLTNNDIIRRMCELVGNDYSKLDDVYVNANTKFKIKHNICSHTYEVTWGNFQNGNRCPKCSLKQQVLKRTLTNEEIIERMYNLVGDEYSKLDDVYVNSSTKFPIKHNICSHEYEVTWSNFQRGVRCPKCGLKQQISKITFDNENIVQKIYDLVGDEYSKLDDVYLGANTKFKIRHNICGYEYEVKWGHFQNGVRCSNCSGNAKLNNEDIVQRMIDLVSDEYSKLNDIYVNAKTKFSIKHNICGHEYEVTWADFQCGKRCPKCNQSKGEKFISDYLTNQNISFATQVRFDDCRHKNPLPFDFGIINSDKEIVALIEFDGHQHFKPIRFSYNITQEQAEKNLKTLQLRDQIKNQYCEDNNIPLLRIRYDEDIEEKITTFLKNKI